MTLPSGAGQGAIIGRRQRQIGAPVAAQNICPPAGPNMISSGPVLGAAGG